MPNRPPSNWKPWFWVAALAMMIIPGIVSLLYLRSAPHKPIDSLAVLPFASAGDDPDAERLSESISDDLINRLSQLPNLTVASREAVMGYKRQESDARVIGRGLGVRAVVQGSIQKRADVFYLSAKLLDAGSGELIWSQQYKLRASDVAAFQNELVKDITDHIRIR
ncbi:MAG: hypothetical protein HY651_06065 [Acidobacteria bacterium]|nr:hypothetical protein [Acidobacteriota bacterium]